MTLLAGALVVSGAVGVGVASAAPKGTYCNANEPIPGDVRLAVEDGSSEHAAVLVDSGTGGYVFAPGVCVGADGVGQVGGSAGLVTGPSPGGSTGATVRPLACAQPSGCTPMGSPTGAGTNVPTVLGGPSGTTHGAGAGTTYCVVANGMPVGDCNQIATARVGVQQGDLPAATNSTVCAVTLPGGSCGLRYQKVSVGTSSNDTAKVDADGPAGRQTPGANVPNVCVDTGTASTSC